jgi:hypothetical protein
MKELATPCLKHRGFKAPPRNFKPPVFNHFRAAVHTPCCCPLTQFTKELHHTQTGMEAIQYIERGELATLWQKGNPNPVEAIPPC